MAEERRFMSWSIIEEKRKEKGILKAPTCSLEGIRLVSAFGESRDLVLSPSRSNLVVQSSRFAVLMQNRAILNLSMVSGPVL